jgi:hypothetical protein
MYLQLLLRLRGKLWVQRHCCLAQLLVIWYSLREVSRSNPTCESVGCVELGCMCEYSLRLSSSSSKKKKKYNRCGFFLKRNKIHISDISFYLVIYYHNNIDCACSAVLIIKGYKCSENMVPVLCKERPSQ